MAATVDNDVCLQHTTSPSHVWSGCLSDGYDRGADREVGEELELYDRCLFAIFWGCPYLGWYGLERRRSANIVDNFAHIHTKCKEPVDQEFSEDNRPFHLLVQALLVSRCPCAGWYGLERRSFDVFASPLCTEMLLLLKMQQMTWNSQWMPL